jgi:hypothetical protein
MPRVLSGPTIAVDRLLLGELLECLRAHERYHTALDATIAIRDDHPIALCPLTKETYRLRDELERALALVV